MNIENVKEVERYFGKSFDEIFMAKKKYVQITLARYYSYYTSNQSLKVWREDVEQCALIGLGKAIETLDINMVGSFTSHIITCIRREILYFENTLFGAKGSVKKSVNVSGVTSLNNTYENGNEEITEIIDQVKNTDGCCSSNLGITEDDILTNIDLKAAINKLPDMEKNLILDLLSNKQQKHIAKELGISEAYLTKKLKKVYEKLNVLLSITI